MIKAAAGEGLDRWVHRLFPFLFWRPLNPNALTVTGSVVSLGAAVAIAQGEMPLGGALVLVGGFFDLVDGVVARSQGRSTAFGGFLDSTLDRLVDSALLFGLGVHFARVDDPWTTAAAGVALVSAVLTSYAKARAELVIDALRGGLLERGERIGLLAAGALLGFPAAATWLLAIGGSITVAQRLAIAYRAMAELEASGVEPTEPLAVAGEPAKPFARPAEPGEAEPGEAEPGEAEPGEAEPGEDEPAEAEPGDAGPA